MAVDPKIIAKDFVKLEAEDGDGLFACVRNFLGSEEQSFSGNALYLKKTSDKAVVGIGSNWDGVIAEISRNELESWVLECDRREQAAERLSGARRKKGERRT